VRYVVALRNPLSVARSRAALDPQRGTQEQSDLEWLVNVVPYFRDLRQHAFVVADYDDLLEHPAPQLERIGAVLGLPKTAATEAAVRSYASEFLRPGMRHTVFTDRDLRQDGRVNQLTRDAYESLRRLATDECSATDRQFWQHWESIEQQLAAMAPVLRHVDRVQSDLRRAQWNPFGPVQAGWLAWRRWRRG
jgi:hypothetical protein